MLTETICGRPLRILTASGVHFEWCAGRVVGVNLGTLAFGQYLYLCIDCRSYLLLSPHWSAPLCSRVCNTEYVLCPPPTIRLASYLQSHTSSSIAMAVFRAHGDTLRADYVRGEMKMRGELRGLIGGGLCE